MITIEINGVKFEGFEQISVSKSVETISGSFTFSATSNNVTTFPIKRSDACKVFINNEAVINGYVDIVDVAYDATSHSISVQGRDRTEDIIDSTLIGKKEFVAPIALTDIIRTTLDSNGLSAINIVNNAGTIAIFPEGTQFSSETGNTIFEFIEKYAQKRQVLLTTNGNGDLVLARSGTRQAITSLQNLQGGQTNNILSGSISYTSEGLYNKYVMRSQDNIGAGAFGGSVEPANAVNRKGEAEDESIRESRQLEIPSKSSDDSGDLGKLAIWHMNLRRARATTYSVNVQGFYQDEAQTRLWKPNELVKVDDDFSDIHSTLLVKSVGYSQSLTSGSTTAIELVSKNSYTLEAQINAADAKANEAGGNLVFG
jgi:prophage tail gpP-like protein